MSKETLSSTEQQDVFQEYLDTFGEGTSQKIKTYLVNEVRKKTDELFLPITAAENVILFGEAGFKSSDYQKKAIESSKRRVQEGLRDKDGTWLDYAADWAAIHLILTGEKCWSKDDEGRMEKDLNQRLNKLLTGHSPDPDSYEEVARHAVNYKLLFNAEAPLSDKKDLITKKIENNMIEHTKMLDVADPSTFAPVSSRAATLRILRASEIIAVKGKGIKIVDSKPSQRFRA